MQTSIANSLDNAGEEAKLDRYAKKIFSHEAILAPLMRMCIPEFREFTDQYIIANCFDSKPEVSSYPVHQDEGRKLDGDRRITQMNSEESAANEATVHYDIRFTARVPANGAIIALIINLEIQARDDLEYAIVTRGLYYCARMISAQYGSVFTHSEYQKIQKVYSIWICPNGENEEHSIMDYQVSELCRLGNQPAKLEDYDKLHVTVIALGRNGPDSTDELIKYLSLILTSDLPLDKRKRELEEQYRIEMNREIEKELSTVCNLGESIARRSMQQGIQQGMQQGIQQGMQQGAFDFAASLFRQGHLSVELAAKQLNMTEKAFVEKVMESEKKVN